MNSDIGKVFIGGVPWETTAAKLRDYFTAYGTVAEAVIIKDRFTGRGRGFGFVIFADPSVADQVLAEKHMIDGRQVEAKKAVPREEQKRLGKIKDAKNFSVLCRLKTKKIFLGGLAASTTEDDIRKYFSQFGTLTDAVIMYAHDTLKPRGFGFITFDSDDAVEQVLQKSFHLVKAKEKMVEVKRAIPRIFFSDPGSTFPSVTAGAGVRRLGVSLRGCSMRAPEMYRGRDGCCYRLNPTDSYIQYGPCSPTGYAGEGGLGFGLNETYGGNGSSNSIPAGEFEVGYGNGSYAITPGGGAVGYGSFTPGLLGGYGSTPIPNSPAWGCGAAGFGTGSYSGYGSNARTETGHAHAHAGAALWGFGGTNPMASQPAVTNCNCKYGLMAFGFVGSENNMFGSSVSGYRAGGSELNFAAVDGSFMKSGGDAAGARFQPESSLCDWSNHGNCLVSGGLSSMMVSCSGFESKNPKRQLGTTSSRKV